MRRISVLLIGLVLFLGVPACSAIFSNLPQVLAIAQDGQLVVSTIESFARTFFVSNPNPDLEKKINTAVARARAALDGAIRAANGTGDLHKGDVDGAFAEFKVAYTDLINLVHPLGISTAGDHLKAVPGGLVVPSPLAFYSR